MGIRLTTAEQKKLGKDGFVMADLPEGVLERQPKATFYKPDGEAMPNLPNDRVSRQRYLQRGFTLEPPTKRKKHLAPHIEAGENKVTRVYLCELCGQEFERKTALLSHKRSRKYREALEAFNVEALETIGG